MVHATAEKFGYPATLLHEGEHWLVLLRPAQVTLGSLVLAAKCDATRYSDLPVEAFAEQHAMVGRIETALASFCRYERINYLMLMMVDPHVHFHVLPRYEGTRSAAGLELADQGWPGPPMLPSAVTLDEQQRSALLAALKPLF